MSERSAELFNSYYFNFDCPRCQKHESIYVECGYESDVDDNGWPEMYLTAIKISQECLCDLQEEDHWSEVQDLAREFYRELGAPE